MHVYDAVLCSLVCIKRTPTAVLTLRQCCMLHQPKLTHDAAVHHGGERILALAITIDCKGCQVQGTRWPTLRQLSWPVQPVQLCQFKPKQEVVICVGTTLPLDGNKQAAPAMTPTR